MLPGPCNRRRASLALIAAALPPVRAAEGSVEALIQHYTFKPATLSVRAGSTVRWRNAETRTSHSILFGGPAGFESERLFPGDTLERRFDRVGSHPYSCGPHPEMKGLIEVVP